MRNEKETKGKEKERDFSPMNFHSLKSIKGRKQDNKNERFKFRDF